MKNSLRTATFLFCFIFSRNHLSRTTNVLPLHVTSDIREKGNEWWKAAEGKKGKPPGFRPSSNLFATFRTSLLLAYRSFQPSLRRRPDSMYTDLSDGLPRTNDTEQKNTTSYGKNPATKETTTPDLLTRRVRNTGTYYVSRHHDERIQRIGYCTHHPSPPRSPTSENLTNYSRPRIRAVRGGGGGPLESHHPKRTKHHHYHNPSLGNTETRDRR